MILFCQTFNIWLVKCNLWTGWGKSLVGHSLHLSLLLKNVHLSMKCDHWQFTEPIMDSLATLSRIVFEEEYSLRVFFPAASVRGPVTSSPKGFFVSFNGWEHTDSAHLVNSRCSRSTWVFCHCRTSNEPLPQPTFHNKPNYFSSNRLGSVPKNKANYFPTLVSNKEQKSLFSFLLREAY